MNDTNHLIVKAYDDFMYRDTSETKIENLIVSLGKVAPCSLSWFKHDTWTLCEAVFLYYGIEPLNDTNSLYPYFWYQIMETIDCMDLNKILSNCFPSLSRFRDQHLSVQQLVAFFKKKDIKIPSHFERELSISDSSSKTSTPNKSSEMSDKQLTMGSDLTKFRQDQLIKLHARTIAAAMWKKNSDLSQKEIIHNERFISQMQSFFKIIELNDWEHKEMDSEWIGDMDKRPKKRGRRRKT